MFNEEQKAYMKTLNEMPLEEKCYCGWNKVGKCYNCDDETKTRADYVAEFNEGLKYFCPYCKAKPGELCQNQVAFMPWENHNERGLEDITPLLREEDNTIYGYQCNLCAGHWKVYQNIYHTSPCTDEKK